jgi:23S rRNA (cytosine1962-C5)-methyltransferase
MKNQDTYTLIDSGREYKLEQFGPYTISRPCSQAVWEPQLPKEVWDKAHAFFSREGENKWTQPKGRLPEVWKVQVSDITFKISPTEFGHLGIFPEQQEFWNWIQKTVSKGKKVLNLFAYSGGATLAAAKAGADVCHLDASKGMVAWARENAALNHLEKAPIRWIIDDVSKFLAREIRRESRYDGIILDPPSFGRGSKGEIFKIEEEITQLLKSCRDLLTSKPLFILFSCHTPGFTPIAMEHLLKQALGGIPGKIDAGEMILTGAPQVFPVPSGTYARWQYGA